MAFLVIFIHLVDFGGRGEYCEPEFEWQQTAGPTAIKFLDSDVLGAQYQNDMFVADYNNGIKPLT
jgi:hypothetical protein